uniref:Pentatricopeptide repeat-containing protein n=1 Tax=Nelumbo nucifera TaxID=4432 RepID=A0A822ZBA6_NELNU|nr:TPA_asm: hypothetical protein HUJ06_015244 [Nelumbo nucifera]
MQLQTRSLLSFARSIVVVLDGSYHVVVFSRNRTIDNLIKCGRLDSAIEIFEAMPVCDIISWNLVIAGHAHHGRPSSSLQSGFAWVQCKLVCWVRTN